MLSKFHIVSICFSSFLNRNFVKWELTLPTTPGDSSAESYCQEIRLPKPREEPKDLMKTVYASEENDKLAKRRSNANLNKAMSRKTSFLDESK